MKNLKKQIAYVLIFLLSQSLFSSTCFASDISSQLISEKMDMTYIVTKNESVYTGSQLNKNHILLVSHGLESIENTEVEIENIDGFKIKGDIVKIDLELDLCLVKTREDLPNKENRIAKPEKYESIFTIGHPLQFEYIVSRGYLSSPFEFDNRTLAQLEVYKGNSGGAVYNSNGDIIGLIHGKRKDTDIALLVSYEDIKYFLKGEIEYEEK